MEVSKLIEKVSTENLSYDEAYFLQKEILEGKLDDIQLISLFQSLERGCSADELRGFFAATREKVQPVVTQVETLDIVGTGGDGFNTINISTMAALVVAASGQCVAKYGNRSATSMCGTADVLEALGAKIEIDAVEVNRCLKESNFAFLFAPFYHQAFRHVRSARKLYGKRTYFNLIGPLLNPAYSTFRLIGVSDRAQVENMLLILGELKVKKAWIVCGSEGLDEISTAGKTHVWEYQNGKIETFILDPKDYGLKYVPISELKGGDAQKNSQILKDILSGNDSSDRALAVILNAAAGLFICGKANSFQDGILMAQEILKRGEASQVLTKYIEASKI